MNLRSFLVVGVAVLGVLPACGTDDLSSLCDKAEECAKKAGTAFSKTECENATKAEKEKASTAGCEDEYEEYASCATGVSYECGDNLEAKVNAQCGAKINAVNKCLQ